MHNVGKGLVTPSIFLSCVHNWMISSSVCVCGTPKAGGLCQKILASILLLETAEVSALGLCLSGLADWRARKIIPWAATESLLMRDLDRRPQGPPWWEKWRVCWFWFENYIIDSIFNSFVVSKLWWGILTKWLRFEFMNVGEISHLIEMILPRVYRVDLLCTRLDFASSNPRLMTLWHGIFGFTFLKPSKEV